MIVVTGSFRLPVANMLAAREAMVRVVKQTRQEVGCIDYAYAEDVMDPGLIRVTEAWHSREALSAHLEAPHMAIWRREREALGLSERRIVAHSIAAEEIL